MVLALFVHCVVLWLRDVGFLCFVIVFVVLSCLMDPLWYCVYFVGEAGACCHDFLRLMACVVSARVCLFFLASLLGYAL